MSVIDRSEILYALHSRLRQFARYAVGRVTGTVHHTDGRYKFFLDVEECRLFFRTELNAILAVLVEKEILTAEEWSARLEVELGRALEDQAKRFPEVKPAADGKSFALDVPGAAKRCKDERWPP